VLERREGQEELKNVKKTPNSSYSSCCALPDGAYRLGIDLVVIAENAKYFQKASDMNTQSS